MSSELDGGSFFARTCISPNQYLGNIPAVETQPNSQYAEADYENTKYEFHYMCKRYRANIKDIKANEARIETKKFSKLTRQEKLDMRKQIVANQYLHTKNEGLLNRILDMLRTQSYVPENPAIAEGMLRLYQQFQKDATEGIRSSQHLLMQLFQNGTLCNLGETCHLNEQRIMANNYTISQFEIESAQIKGLSSSHPVTLPEIERLKNITMLCRGLLEENRTLLNENKNLYLQSSNVRQMAGELGDCMNISRRLVRCTVNLEANKKEFHFLLRISAELTTNPKVAQEEKVVKKGNQDALVASTSKYSNSFASSSVQLQPSPVDLYVGGGIGTGPIGIQTVGSDNLPVDRIVDRDLSGFGTVVHSCDAEEFVNRILNQTLQQHYGDVGVNQDAGKK